MTDTKRPPREAQIATAATMAATAKDGIAATMAAAGDRPDEAPSGAAETLAPEATRYGAPQELGRGGMGVVQLREDSRIGREVAVKSLHAELAGDRDAASRFLREARIQGQLEHPAIVPVYDLSRAPDGELYFTMKQIRGQTLASVIEARAAGRDSGAAFTKRRLLTAFSQVCLAVDFAHRRGVIHRDLKPENVMLGEFGEVYVLDWGIARFRGERDTDEQGAATIRDAGTGGSTTRTRVGSLLGTPGYMPPEQARGQLDAIDAQSDVWSLGAILFELLTLEPMIPRDATVTSLITTTVEGEYSLERLDAEGLAPELAALCRQAVAVEPRERLESARALSDAIERYLDGERDEEARRERAAEHAEQARLAGRHPRRARARAAQLAADRALDVPHRPRPPAGRRRAPHRPPPALAALAARGARLTGSSYLPPKTRPA